MAKSITINLDHTYTSKGRTLSVAEALAWVEKVTSEVDEETGEETGPAYDAGDLIVYAVNRMRALHKDGKRYRSGKLAARLYAPRLDHVEHAPKPLVQAVEAIDAAEEKLRPPERKLRASKDDAKPAAASIAAKPATAARKAMRKA
jgi:hypothetical protein